MYAIPLNSQSRFYHVAFIALLIALVVFKWHDLHLPYFWDELGVYCQAAINFYHQGPSLMPGSLNPEISRGHPLLFQFLSGWALRILGNNPFSAHLFALFISLALLTAVYLKIAQLYNRATAFATSLILVVQPAFLAISGLLLPEIMLALWVWLGLTNYYQRNYVLSGLFVSLAILTKESAISIPAVLIAYSMLHYIFFRDHRGAFKPIALLCTMAPYIIFALFLYLQKLQNGWYFFPYHVNTISTDLHVVLFNLKGYLNFLLFQYNRIGLSVLLIAATISSLVKGIKLAACRDSFLPLVIGMSMAVVAGSCFAFYMARYVMVVFPAIALLTALGIYKLINAPLLRAAILVTLTVLAIKGSSGNQFNYEEDLAYRKSVTTMQNAIRYTETMLGQGDTVIARFPAYFALMNPEYGYTTRHLPGLPADSLYWHHVYYIDTDPGVWEPKPWPDSLFVPVKQFKEGYATATVFELLVRDRQRLHLK